VKEVLREKKVDGEGSPGGQKGCLALMVILGPRGFIGKEEHVGKPGVRGVPRRLPETFSSTQSLGTLSRAREKGGRTV